MKPAASELDANPYAPPGSDTGLQSAKLVGKRPHLLVEIARTLITLFGIVAGWIVMGMSGLQFPGVVVGLGLIAAACWLALTGRNTRGQKPLELVE